MASRGLRSCGSSTVFTRTSCLPVPADRLHAPASSPRLVLSSGPRGQPAIGVSPASSICFSRRRSSSTWCSGRRRARRATTRPAIPPGGQELDPHPHLGAASGGRLLEAHRAVVVDLGAGQRAPDQQLARPVLEDLRLPFPRLAGGAARDPHRPAAAALGHGHDALHEEREVLQAAPERVHLRHRPGDGDRDLHREVVVGAGVQPLLLVVLRRPHVQLVVHRAAPGDPAMGEPGPGRGQQQRGERAAARGGEGEERGAQGDRDAALGDADVDLVQLLVHRRDPRFR